jgi:hypothetical protein
MDWTVVVDVPVVGADAVCMTGVELEVDVALPLVGALVV